MKDNIITATLKVLHEKSDLDSRQRQLQRAAQVDRRNEQAHQWDTAYMAVGKEEGEFLYFLANVSKAKNIVEFGCSFGISTIYLAAAAKNNGGHVTTSDFERTKVEGAAKNLADAGLRDFVTILAGDALQTLAGVEGAIDLLFLDGDKDLYLPVFEMLKPKLKIGSIILADNADRNEVQDFNKLLTSSNDNYITSFLFEGRLLTAICI